MSLIMMIVRDGDDHGSSSSDIGCRLIVDIRGATAPIHELYRLSSLFPFINVSLGLVSWLLTVRICNDCTYESILSKW